MFSASVVDMGGWDEKYAFKDEKDALAFYALCKKATKCTSEYLKGEGYCFQAKEKQKISLTDGNVYNAEEYELLKKEETA